jgi:hypothetical protein
VKAALREKRCPKMLDDVEAKGDGDTMGCGKRAGPSVLRFCFLPEAVLCFFCFFPPILLFCASLLSPLVFVSCEPVFSVLRYVPHFSFHSDQRPSMTLATPSPDSHSLNHLHEG